MSGFEHPFALFFFADSVVVFYFAQIECGFSAGVFILFCRLERPGI